MKVLKKLNDDMIWRSSFLYCFLWLLQTSGLCANNLPVKGPVTTGKITISALFSDHMVLQRNRKIPFWGTAAPGQKITVSLQNHLVSAVTDQQGKWLIRLPAQKEGGPFEVVISGRDTIRLKDVFIGDVWLASGQSNMEMTLGPTRFFAGAANSAQEMANSTDSLLRVFTVVKNSTIDGPQTQVAGHWQLSNPQNSGDFTAVGYFFARELRKKLGIPIGIIHSTWGASSAQAWTSKKTLMSNAYLQPIVSNWEQMLAAFNDKYAQFKADSTAWQKLADQAKVAGVDEPASKPKPPARPLVPQKRPASLYNGMIAPLIPFGIKGIIWYQGEGNSDDPKQYQILFPALIANWRQDWGQGDFPFLFVQLANFKKPQEQPIEDGWPGLREVQRLTSLSVPNTGMAVAIDIGDEKEIHFPNKQDVGLRLALCALAQVYHQPVTYSGPMFQSAKIKGNTMRLHFKHDPGGLIWRDSKAIKGFAIAGADKKFVWADAKIEGDDLVISSPQVTVPVAARYNWANNPIGNLYNQSGLPASPFRTDNW